MLLSLNAILQGLAYKSVGRCSLNIFNTKITVVVFIFGRRVAFLLSLMVDKLFLGYDGAIANPLKVLLMGGQKGIIALWHFSTILRDAAIIHGRVGQIVLMCILMISIIGRVICVIVYAHLSI